MIRPAGPRRSRRVAPAAILATLGLLLAGLVSGLLGGQAIEGRAAAYRPVEGMATPICRVPSGAPTP